MAKKVETKITLSGDAEGAKKAIGQTEQELEKLGKKAKEQSKDVEAFGLSLSTALRAAAASLVAAQFIDANKSLEQLERGFTAVTGSAEDGAKALQRAKEIAEQLGAPLASTAQAYLDFSAAVQGSAIQGEVADAVFGAVTSALGAMGASTERTQNALLALSQMAAKGTISMEELRGQLGEALPQGMRAMASGLGLTVAELTKLVESGKLLAEDGLPALGRALLEVGGAGGKADTFTANWERLKNAVNEAYTTIGQGVVWQGLISALTYVTKEVRDLSKGIDEAVIRLRAWKEGVDVATIRLWDQQAAVAKAAEATKEHADSILDSSTSYARLTLDVDTATKSLDSWIKNEAAVSQAAQTATKAEIDLAQSLGHETEARNLAVQAAKDQADLAQKRVNALSGEVGLLDSVISAYEKERAEIGQLSTARQAALDAAKDERREKQAALTLAEANLKASKTEAEQAKATAAAQANHGQSMEGLGRAYALVTEEVKRLTQEERAGKEAAGAIARTQEELAQIRERIFTASANAASGDAAWAEKARILSGEEERLTAELNRLLDVQATGIAAGKVLASARETQTKAELAYREAIKATIDESEKRLDQAERQSQIEQALTEAKLTQAQGAERALQTEAETLRVKAAVAKALGDETRAQDLLSQAKQKDEDATRKQVQQARIEAQVAQQAAEAKQAKLVELEKQLALNIRLANIDGVVTDAEQEHIDAARQAVEATGAQAEKLEAAAGAAGRYASATAEAAQANLDLSDAQQQAERSARITAESMAEQNRRMTEATSLTLVVRQRYYELSEAAGKFFDNMMAGVQSLEQWRDTLADATFERIKRQFQDMAANVGYLTEKLQSSAVTMEDVARAERILAGEAIAVAQGLNYVGENELNPLRSAIEAAKQQLESVQDTLKAMTEDAAAGVRSLQSEIASLQGDSVQVAALDHQEKLLAIQERLNAAVAAGNQEAIALFQQQIALEDQRYKLQLDQIQAGAGDNQAAKLRAQIEKERVNAARDVEDATKRAEDALKAATQAAKDGEAGFKGIFDWVMGAQKASETLATTLKDLAKAPVKIPIEFTYGGNQALLQALVNALALANRSLPGGAR